jgi:hypothetical protein
VDGVQIVVTCTSRKRLPVPPRLRFRNISGATAAVRHSAWSQALLDARVEATTATDLYGGDAWQIARSLPDQVRWHRWDERPRLWVASAGYGLVPESASLKPYAATFAPNHPDTVVRRSDPGRGSSIAHQWWSLLSRTSSQDAPRSLAALAAARADDVLLVVTSAAYLAALRDDLAAARARLTSPERLLIISVGGSLTGPLAQNRLPADARLRQLVGGTLTALNVRVARWLLQQVPPRDLTFPVAHDFLTHALAGVPAWTPAAGVRLGDTEVRQLILRERAEQPTLSRTTLLRRLREAGYACEQARFAAILRSIPEPTRGRT